MKLTSSNAELDKKLILHGEGDDDLLKGIYFIDELLLTVLRMEIYWLFPAEEIPVDNEVSEDGFRIISLLLPAADLFYS